MRADVIRILEESGLGLPPYMAWGRTRSGCYFCFYQQKIEWVRLAGCGRIGSDGAIG